MCSYCGCESVAVVGRFTAEHAEIVDASGELRRACAGPGTDVTGAADRLHGLLQPHTRDREENGRFPAAAIAVAGPEWERVDALTPAVAVRSPGP